MNRFARAVIACIAAALAVPAVATNAVTTVGVTDARRCYEESLVPISDTGIRFCTDAIETDNLVRRELAATLTNRGIIHAANGRPEEALSDYNRAADLSPTTCGIFINRGNLYYRLSDYDSALADYATAMACDGVARSIVLYNRALVLLKLKRWDDARAALEEALLVDPESRRIRQKLAEMDAAGISTR